MPIRTRDVEWLQHNTQRAYPFAAETTRQDLTESLVIPDDFIVGLTLPVHWGVTVQTGKFFLRRLAVYANGYWLTIGYDSADGPVDVAAALVPKDSHVFGNYYTLNGLGDFIDSRGFVQIGRTENIDLQPSGQFEFDLAGARFEPDAIHPFIRGVMSLQVQNGDELSAPLTGRVILAAGRNERLRTVLVEGEDPVVIFDAIDGEGLSEDCVCNENQANPIRTISLVGPDGTGNLDLLGNECFVITAGTNALIIEDKCSQACCGCKELETVSSRLEAFGSQATTLENFLVRLESSVSTFDSVVLGSRLGDRGCTPAADCP